MNKKLMLLAAGALAALAFTALPGAASAEETTLKCLGTGVCTYTIHGGASAFSIDRASPGDTVLCETVTGHGEVTGLNEERESTTTTTTLTFHNCREQITIFKFACTSAGQPSGTVKTNALVGHHVKLTKDHTPTEAGILLTDSNVTFTCAGGFARTTVTGDVIGEYEKPCGPESKSKVQKVQFTLENNQHGTQTPRIYTGEPYDLEAATNHNQTPTPTTGYETAAQTGTGTITFNQEVELTCKA